MAYTVLLASTDQRDSACASGAWAFLGQVSLGPKCFDGNRHGKRRSEEELLDQARG